MRTTPLADWRAQAERFDREVRRVAEDVLGVPLSDRAWTQAALTPSLGGLGLRRVVDHAEGAFAASWTESQVTARESWVQPLGLVHRGSQTQASLAFDRSAHAKFLSHNGETAFNQVGRTRGSLGYRCPFEGGGIGLRDDPACLSYRGPVPFGGLCGAL